MYIKGSHKVLPITDQAVTETKKLKVLQGKVLLTAKQLRNLANKITKLGMNDDFSIDMRIMLNDHADDLEKAARA